MDKELLDQLFQRYEQVAFLNKLGDVAQKKFFADPLETEERKLSILTKKKMLGLPVDSEDYEDATNEGQSFYAKVSPSLAKHGIQAIPGPSFLSGVKHPPVEPVYKVATFVDSLLPSVRKSSTKIAKDSFYAGSRLPGFARSFLNL